MRSGEQVQRDGWERSARVRAQGTAADRMRIPQDVAIQRQEWQCIFMEVGDARGREGDTVRSVVASPPDDDALPPTPQAAPVLGPSGPSVEGSPPAAEAPPVLLAD